MEIPILSKTLFNGFTQEEEKQILQFLGARRRQFEKGEQIFRVGEITTAMGVVLSGGATVEAIDPWGNSSVLSYLAEGQIFAEAYACVEEEPLMVNVVAAQPTEALFLDVHKILQAGRECTFDSWLLLCNLMKILAEKNLHLSRRGLHTAPKTIRERVLAYLASQQLRQGSAYVEIPFNRQQMADYLNVDRSALSGELGKMQREGLLKVRKNRFWILPPLREQ